MPCVTASVSEQPVGSKRWSAHCTVVHTGHLQQLLSQQAGLTGALSRQLWEDSLHISVVAQVGCCSPDLLFLWLLCPFQVLLSVRVGVWVILSFSSGLRTLVLWNFLYMEMRLCTHAHMCTLRMDPGRKEGGRSENKRGWWERKRNAAYIVIYGGVWDIYGMKVEEEDCGRKAGVRRRGKKRGWEGQMSRCHDVRVRECHKKPISNDVTAQHMCRDQRTHLWELVLSPNRVGFSIELGWQVP